MNRDPVSNLQRNGEIRGDGERENHQSRENYRRVALFVLKGQKWGAGSSDWHICLRSSPCLIIIFVSV